MTIRKLPEELKQLAPQVRTFRLMPNMESADGMIDMESRTMRLPFSSEMPCDMWYGTEILSHAPGAMRMGVRQEFLPLLFNHNRDDLLGVIESIEIGADSRGYANIRFGKDARGDWAMKQVSDNVLVNVSFMYRVYKFEEDFEAEIYTAMDYEIYEISLVTVPADATIGIGRAAGDEENPVIIEVRGSPPTQTTASNTEPAASGFFFAQQGSTTPKGNEMKNRHLLQEQADSGDTGGAGGAIVLDESKYRVEGAVNERKRIAEIEALCRQHKAPDDLRTGLVQRGATVGEAQTAVLDFVMTRSTLPAIDLGNGYSPDMDSREKSKYSMMRAINAAISKDWKLAGFELEVSNEISKRMGKDTTGFFMPTNIPFAQRAQYASGASATGGALVETNLLAGSFIEILRNKARVLQLGATVLSGLVGNVVIPRQTGASTAYWVAETGSITSSEATFDQMTLTFKSVGARSAITRSMLMQSTPDIEMIARADLIAQIALEVDRAALSGTGASNQPTGIANTAGIGSVVGGTNGAQVTIDHLIDLETAIAVGNADVDTMAYLANAKTVGWLKKLKSTTGQYLWTQSATGGRSATPIDINGYPMARSNQARSNLTKGTSVGVASEIFMGNWSELVIGEWGVLEILPNPYDSTLYPQGGVLLRAMQSLDIGVRHAASFAVMSDGLTV